MKTSNRIQQFRTNRAAERQIHNLLKSDTYNLF
jgi:hypothetical protein